MSAIDSYISGRKELPTNYLYNYRLLKKALERLEGKLEDIRKAREIFLR